MCDRPAETFFRYVFMSDRLYHIRAGNEHVTRPIDHEHEVSECGRINRSPCARSHYCGNLRDDPAREGVTEEDVGISSQGHTPS